MYLIRKNLMTGQSDILDDHGVVIDSKVSLEDITDRYVLYDRGYWSANGYRYQEIYPRYKAE